MLTFKEECKVVKPLCKETGDAIENTCLVVCMDRCTDERQDRCFDLFLESFTFEVEVR